MINTILSIFICNQKYALSVQESVSHVKMDIPAIDAQLENISKNKLIDALNVQI